MKKQSIIGSTETIDFPELQLFGVPAKTDTGADSSAIWASQAVVTPEGLQFVLFGPGSEFYTGTPILADTYRTTSVKNSFGEAEFRYKVRLLLRVGGRSVRAWFNLSERAGMRFPVLLGRRLLKNKFLVDVSRSQRSRNGGETKRVLMLGAISGDLQQFASEVQSHMKTPAELTACGFDDLRFDVQTNKVHVSEITTGRDLADFDIVYFKSHKNKYECAVAAARYLAYKHVPFFDQELLTHVSYDKLSEQVALALHGVPVPSALTVSKEHLPTEFKTAAKVFGLPLVCKEINADRGRKNFLLQNEQDLQAVLDQAEPSDTYMLQQFVPNDGYMRLFVFGADVGLTVQRTPVGHADRRKTHLNNATGGTNATLVEPSKVPSAAYDLSIRASRLLNRQVSGVDVIQDKNTKQWYVLEVNTAPQLKTGSYVPEKRVALAQFLDFELNR